MDRFFFFLSEQKNFNLFRSIEKKIFLNKNFSHSSFLNEKKHCEKKCLQKFLEMGKRMTLEAVTVFMAVRLDRKGPFLVTVYRKAEKKAFQQFFSEFFSLKRFHFFIDCHILLGYFQKRKTDKSNKKWRYIFYRYLLVHTKPLNHFRSRIFFSVKFLILSNGPFLRKIKDC